MLVSKFVLTRIHHCIGEKGDLGRATQFRFLDSIEEEAMSGGKNHDLFILLLFECLFGIKSMNISCFYLTKNDKKNHHSLLKENEWLEEKVKSKRG